LILIAIYIINFFRMKSIYLFSLIIILPTGCIGQITLTAATYFPNAGDSLRTVTATAQTTARVVMTPASATQQTWDYTALRSTPIINVQKFLDAATDTAMQRAFPGVDLVTKQGVGQTQTACYNKTLTRFELMGFKGVALQGLNLALNPAFTPSVPERRAPLIYNTGNNNLRYAFLLPFAANLLPDSLLNLLPIRPDSLRIDFATIRTDKVDAWGSLKIPGGTYDVLRERRFTIDETRIEMKINALRMWVDITPILFNTPQGNPSRDTTISYHFWSNTAKEPIAVVTLKPYVDSAAQIQYKYHFVSPVEHALSNDSKIKLYPNPASSEFYLDLEASGTFVLTLSDITGKILLKQNIESAGHQKVQIPVNHLPDGMYWGVLHDATGQRVFAKPVLKVNSN
jgi:Secretion system C-terminal sorting domain